MNLLTIAVLIFAALGAADRVFGNKLGLGKEFEKAFMLLGVMALSMIGMIVIAPVIAKMMGGASSALCNMLKIDPSIIPASLFANDMGGAAVAVKIAQNSEIGSYNALIVSSMLGCTVSFTIPFALGAVKKEQHNELLLGLLCGIITIPTGCFVSGLICRIPIGALVLNLIPLISFSVIIAVCLILIPDKCIKVLKIFGFFITAIITFGLLCGMINFLTGKDVVKGIAPIEDGAKICFNAAIVLSGFFPLLYVCTKILSRPLKYIGGKAGINEASVMGVVSTLASNAPAFGMMEKMDKKGAVLNSAFAVSGAFVFGAHFAFTMAFDKSYIVPLIAGKLVSGFFALAVAFIIYGRNIKKQSAASK